MATGEAYTNDSMNSQPTASVQIKKLSETVGLGVSIMSRFTLGLEPKPSRLICLDVEGFPLENHWYIAYPAGKQLSATARAFMDFARLEAKGLVMGELPGLAKAMDSCKAE